MVSYQISYDSFVFSLSTLKKFDSRLQFEPIVCDGFIHRFELTVEKAIALIEAYFDYKAIAGLSSIEMILKEAQRNKLISDLDAWKNMIAEKEKASSKDAWNAYYVNLLLDKYVPLLKELAKTLNYKLVVKE